MNKICLIQTSNERSIELLHYIDSLNNQKGVDFSTVQYVFVDQGDNKACFDRLDRRFNFKYVSSEPVSLSKARNIGLKYANSDYVCFPDDDCWYDQDTLSNVLNSLKTYKDGVAIVAKDDDGTLINNFGSSPAYLTKYNQHGVLSISIFVRYFSDMRFDENLGVGSKLGLGSGEETDYLLRLIKEKDLKIRFLPDITIRHPSGNKEITKEDLEKVLLYGRGYGYVMRKNHFNPVYVAYKMMRPLWGYCFNIISGNELRRQRSLARFKGIKEGYFFKQIYNETT